MNDLSGRLELKSRVIEARCSLCGYEKHPVLSHWKPTKRKSTIETKDISNALECAVPSVSNSEKSDARSRFTMELEFACFICAECGKLVARRKFVSRVPAYVAAQAIFIIICSVVVTRTSAYAIFYLTGLVAVFLLTIITYAIMSAFFPKWSSPDICTKCGSSSLNPLWKQLGIAFPCPNCNSKTLIYSESRMVVSKSER